MNIPGYAPSLCLLGLNYFLDQEPGVIRVRIGDEKGGALHLPCLPPVLGGLLYSVRQPLPLLIFANIAVGPIVATSPGRNIPVPYHHPPPPSYLSLLFSRNPNSLSRSTISIAQQTHSLEKSISGCKLTPVFQVSIP